jgi:hypothetical protein
MQYQKRELGFGCLKMKDHLSLLKKNFHAISSAKMA